ncbi:MAG: hypothetical protein ACFFAX_04860 [Promethearchaeota archaeon]
MIENEHSRKLEERINAMDSDSSLRSLPYGDSLIFPDREKYFLAVGIGDRVVVRELSEYPINWETKNLLAMTVAAVERLKDAPDSLWRHRAQINCLLDLRVYLPCYRGLNSSIVPALRAALAESNYANLRTYIRADLLRLLKNQIVQGGPTHFFDINEMKQIPELAVHVPRVLELRKNEIQGVTLVERDGAIDLTPIIMTAWGFELVHALGLGLVTDAEGCDAIQRELYELDLEIDISKEEVDASNPVEMCVGLSQYIQSLFK